MFSSLLDTDVLIGGLFLSALQVLAAIPWLRAIDPRGFDAGARNIVSWSYAIGGFLIVALFVTIALGYKQDSENLQLYGRIYGTVLHLQLLVDLFLLFPALLAWLLPKTGAVALAAYREAWRQPMFWLIMTFGVVLTWLFVVLPYFTFDDDYKMMKLIGFDIVMLCGALFGVLAASISISEEIEGRTAITVMSKPINRRQFFIGKFLGLLMACGALSLLLGWNLNAALLVMPEFDPLNKDKGDPITTQVIEQFMPTIISATPPGPASAMMEGAGRWFCEAFAHSAGILLGFGQVMILLTVATALATRLPFMVNIIFCLLVYFLGHLAPVVVRVTQSTENAGTTGIGLVRFLGNLFDTLLPALEFFNMSPAIIRDAPLQFWPFVYYILTVSAYSVLYTIITVIIGLLLFEDRDLA